MPLRYVLLGKSGGVGIAPLLASLEKEEIIKRIQNALESFKSQYLQNQSLQILLRALRNSLTFRLGMMTFHSG